MNLRMSTGTGTGMKRISILIPVFNEEPNVEQAYYAVTKVMAGLGDRYDYEILFTDNHSQDETFRIVRDLAARDPRVRAARFSKNFGYQQSIFSGYALATGDAAIQLDCDLQDPPELIPELLEHWERGFQVVYGVRRNRQEGRWITGARKLFYRALARMSDDPLPVDAGDFRLLDRVIIDQLTRFWDHSPYLRGSIAWLGFRQIGIPYDRRARQAGTTKFSLPKLVSLAIDGILVHSVLPLRAATYLGVLTGLAAVAGGIGYLVGRFLLGRQWPAGFTTIVLLQLAAISVNGVFLGIIGEYLSRIYLQSKRRPITVIEETVNLPDAPRAVRGGGPAAGATPVDPVADETRRQRA